MLIFLPYVICLYFDQQIVWKQDYPQSFCSILTLLHCYYVHALQKAHTTYVSSKTNIHLPYKH